MVFKSTYRLAVFSFASDEDQGLYLYTKDRSQDVESEFRSRLNALNER